MDRIYKVYRMRRKKINPVNLVNPVHFRVPSAGWRIREIPDCASSPKTHNKPKLGEENFA